MKYVVIGPSKGHFLLFTAMNLAGYNDNNGHPALHDLRLKTRTSLASEINNPWLLRFSEEQKGWVNSKYRLGEVASDIKRQEVGLPVSDSYFSEKIRDYLRQFQASSGFEQFYQSILPEYRAICDEVVQSIGNKDFSSVLNKAWENKPSFSLRIIPMPLESAYRGNGPLIGSVAYCLMGPRIIDGKATFAAPDLKTIIAHEASHSYAKPLIVEIRQIIESRGLIDIVDNFISQQKTRNYEGSTALEETMMRAMQARFINPYLGFKRDPDQLLEKEFSMEKCQHIFAFDEAIRKHKEKPRGTLAEAMVDLVETLMAT